MAEQIKAELSTDEKNRLIDGGVRKKFAECDEFFLKSVDAAKAKHPEIHPGIFDAIKKAHQEHLPKFIDGVINAQQYKKEFDSQLSMEGINKKIGVAYEEFRVSVKDKVKTAASGLVPEAIMDGQIEKAYKAIEPELPKDGVGIFGTIGKAFFDPDKGGIRWGAIAGLAAGLWAGTAMGGGLEGGILGIVALAVLAIGGVMLGNFVSDAYSDKKEPEKEKGQEKSLKRDTALKPKVEKDKELNSQIVKLDPSGTTIIYVDKDGKNVPISQGVPANIAELMQIKINSGAGKDLASVTEVALIDKSDGEARPVKMSPKSPVNFKVQKNESNGSYIELGEESVQADLKNLRESVEEEMKKSKGGNAESLEQRKDVKTEKTAETSGQPFEDISLKGYVASEDYKEQRAKEQADELKKKSGGSGVTLTPDGATNHSIPNVLLEFARANTQGK